MFEIDRLIALAYDELISVDQIEDGEKKDRPETEYKLRKVWFFLFAEGFKRTLAKISSKRNSLLTVTKYRTIIKVRYNHKLYLNYSIQTSKDLKDFVVRNEFFEIDENAVHSFETANLNFNQFVPNESTDGFKIKPIAISEKKKNSASIISATYDKGVFLYGLGDYSRVYIAPNLKKLRKIYCIDYVSKYADFYKTSYNYDFSGLVPQQSYNEIGLVKKPLVIIATYHSDHTRIASDIFNINPNTVFFIEKPPCVTLDDISKLVELYRKGAHIEIGYNRRYIPINQEIKKRLKGQRAVINISIKEILINDNHWYFWENQGTRVTGNLTHWIDICNFWLEGEIPIELNMLKSSSKDETFTVSILYSNGSLANITVSDKGNSLRGVQEKIEIRTELETFHIDDYQKIYFINKNGRRHTRNRIKRIKGHDEMYKHVVNLYHEKADFSYSVQDLIKTSLTTYHLSEMFKKDIRNFKIKDTIVFMLNESDVLNSKSTI